MVIIQKNGLAGAGIMIIMIGITIEPPFLS